MRFTWQNKTIPQFPSRANPNPPGAWTPFRKRVQRILAPVERFLAIEAASGIVLTVVAVAALVWANSPWRAVYSALWHIPIGFRFGSFGFERDVHFWINDGLMTVFFFVVGLEIRREIHSGELSQVRRAAFPLAAALGGMLVPALIFFFFNVGRSSAAGWAVPMATDIAFAVGALTLFGQQSDSRASHSFVGSCAVIDDVGRDCCDRYILFSGLCCDGLRNSWSRNHRERLLCSSLVFARLSLIVAPERSIWAGAYLGGIHPTLAGVIVGFHDAGESVVRG
jgi:NhaA family Na+:H+ antiporter